MPRNYYVVLGVPSDAAPDLIRSAFRCLARRYHPDRGNESDPRSFREVAEAYDVLPDPGRRARYDRQFQRRRRQHSVRSGIPVPGERDPIVSEPLSVVDRPETVRPSLDSFMERIARSFCEVGIPKADGLEPINFDLILSREEAASGIRVPLRFPVFAICRQCGGTGRDLLFPCDDCGGEGRLVDQAEVKLDLPRGRLYIRR